MPLPGFKLDTQHKLFYEPIDGHGQVRVLLGDFVEKLTAKLLGGVRYRTDSRCDYCPDVTVGNRFFEVKAVGNTNYTFIYEGRLEKDLVFAQTHELYYVLWSHGTDTLLCEDEFELFSWFIHNLKEVLIVPFTSMYEVAQSQPLTKLNSNYGHCRDTATAKTLYGAGRRISLRKIKQQVHQSIVIQHSDELF